MKQSQLFLNTLREAPGGADAVSHQLMLRAGLIRQSAAGVYSFLPLGFRVLKKIEDIIRTEMNKGGAQEVLLPSMQPADLWQHSGRWEEYGSELIRFEDRNGRQTVLGPTHEEVVTSLVQNEVSSYRQLPLTLYQIQTKFRDERRPRAGLLRGREFRMKDAYSFDVDMDGLNRSYEAMYRAYCHIFDRLGVEYLAVEADGGAIGKEGPTHEFIVISDAGEDTIVTCPDCGYAANTEVCTASKGDACGVCGSALQWIRGIEVGHIFQLGTKYSGGFGATFLDEQGETHTIQMGCYGIGTSRLMPAIIEQCHDEHGIIWPPSVAPFDVHVVPVNTKDAAQTAAAAGLYEALVAAGFDVLVDDRAERPGVKFKDADLLGLPLRVTIGNKIQEGRVEIRDRKTELSVDVPLEQVAAWCQAHFAVGQ